MSEKVKLYHGGTDRFPFNPKKVHLFAQVFPEVSKLSGNLTDSFDFARKYAQMRSSKVGGNAVILLYEFDENEIVNLGPIGLFGETGFHTVYRSKATELPQGFLQSNGLTIRSAIEAEARGKVIYYRAPKENFRERVR